MTRILGIDPGSRITGFGVIDVLGTRNRYVASGCIQVRGESLSKRLKCIFEGVSEVVERHRPAELAIEQVFMHRNAASALKLGQARGAAMLAGELGMLDVYEYTATQIKLSVTGMGRATKAQIQHMIKILLCLSSVPQSDAADALGVALCHAHIHGTRVKIERAAAEAEH